MFNNFVDGSRTAKARARDRCIGRDEKGHKCLANLLSELDRRLARPLAFYLSVSLEDFVRAFRGI